MLDIFLGFGQLPHQRSNGPLKTSEPTPGYRWGLVLIACKKRQMPHHSGQEIAKKCLTPAATEDVPD